MAARNRADAAMIPNEQELKVARERIAYLIDLLARVGTTLTGGP
jgi:hypothetical protein